MGAEKGKTNRNIRGCFTLNHCHQSVSLTRQERWRYASTQSFSLFHTHKHTHTHIFMTWFLRVFPLICIHLFTGISAKSVAAYVFIYTHVLHVHSLCHAHAAHSYAYRSISHACVHTQQHGVMTAFAHTHTHPHSFLFPRTYAGVLQSSLFITLHSLNNTVDKSLSCPSPLIPCVAFSFLLVPSFHLSVCQSNWKNVSYFSSPMFNFKK